MMMNSIRRATMLAKVRPNFVRPVLARNFSLHYDHREAQLDDFHEYYDHFKPEMFEWVIDGHQYTMFQLTYCPHCKKARETLQELGHRAYIINVDHCENMKEVMYATWARTGLRTYPKIFYNGELIGGNSDLQKLIKEGKFK